MGEWREYKISDIADVIGGGTPKTAIDEYWNGDIPWLAPRDLTGYDKVYISHGDRFITKDGLKNSSTKLMPKGSVLLTSRAPIGYVAIAENEICTNQGFKSLVPKQDKCRSEFLYYWIKNSVDYLQQLGTGTTFAEISGSVVKSIDISLPPLKEQKAIAEVLSSLDDKIDLLVSQNKTLEELAQTLFRQWFIEEAKDDWEVGILEDIIEFNPTHSLKKGEMYPFLEMGNVQTFKSSVAGWYDRAFTSGTKFKNGDTLLARITPSLENGKTAYVDFLKNDEIGWGSTEFVVMRMKKSYHPFISYLIARNEDFRDFAIGNMTGSTGRQRAQAKDIKEYEIGIPVSEVIQKLNEIITPIPIKIQANSKQIKTLENIRDTLLPKLMSGEVRVRI